MILGLRLGRRLIAAVGVSDESIAFQDCRYVSTRPEVLERASGSYFTRLLEQLRPQRIAVFAPTNTTTATERLMALLAKQAAQLSIPVTRLDRSALLRSVGLRDRANRQAAMDKVSDLWPSVTERRRPRQLVLAEALLSALIEDLESQITS